MNTFLLSKNVSRLRVLATIERFLRCLPGSCDFEVTIRKHHPKRSDQQNRALWGCAYKVLSEATGNDPDDLHEYFLGEWGGWEIREVMGQKRRVPMRRSSKLNTVDFNAFYAFIQQRSAETVGVYVPDPDPNYWMKAA